MTVSHVLEEVSKAGLTLRLTPAGSINARPVDRLTPALRDLLTAYKADLVVALREQPLSKRTAPPVVIADADLDHRLFEAAMRCCDHWNDGPEARAQMVADIRATPQHHRQELLEHFQAWYGKPK
jgi:hypothetical protein